MTLTYTTTEAIANRLRGRLNVGVPQTPFGNTVVDPNLIGQVGAQVEARVNAQLRGVYTLPLKLTDDGAKAILASVVEKLVICELMGTHFVGAEATSEDGYGRMMCRQGDNELSQILLGALTLPGEAPAGIQGAVVANYSSSGRRTPGAAEGIQF